MFTVFYAEFLAFTDKYLNKFYIFIVYLCLMRNKRTQFLFILVLLLLTISCKKETESVTFDFGYSYFPDDSGTYVIYKVDSVLYNDFDPLNLKRSSTHYLKEVITEQFTDNLGRTARKVERFVADSLDKPWIPFNVWYLVKNKTNAEKVEDNIRYIKITFPVSVGNTWRGNKYNELNHFPFVDLKFTTTNFDWNYEVKSINETFSNAEVFSDSTMTILQAADSSNVQKVYSLEKYAKNIGMVYKELWRLDAQLVDDQTYEEDAVFGFILRQTAVKYGKE